MALINSISITEFSFTTSNIGLETAAAGVGNMSYVKDNQFESKRFAIKISTDIGVTGEYVTNWVSTPSSFGQATMLAPTLLK